MQQLTLRPARAASTPPAARRALSIGIVRPVNVAAPRRAFGSRVKYQPDSSTASAGVQAHEASSKEGSSRAAELAPSRQHEANSLDEATRVIGLGQRGISAAARLMSNQGMPGAEFWMLDTDAQVLSSSKCPNCVQLPMEDDAQLSQQQLEQLTGRALSPEAAAASAADGQQGLNFPVTTSGVAYLLGAAGGIPGGSKLVLQLACHLRRAGFFVLASLTLPFDFEGRRKVEEASALVEALQDVANVVVVVPQGVLVRASAQLTVTQALEIADMTLETSCRAIQWALNVPEVLLASAGGMLWHGRDLRQYRRLLSPPMELLGTCPGAGHVGRGYASMPLQHLSDAGWATSLSTLAETAVVAAAESPFLDNVLSSASGVLCVLSLPERVLRQELGMSAGAVSDPDKYAIRAAVQVAASMVVDLVGHRCDEVVACAYIRHDWPHKDGAGELCMEATLLVVEDPAAAEEKEDAVTPGASSKAPAATASSPAAAATSRFAGRLSSGPILHPALMKQQQPAGQQQQVVQHQQQPQQQPQQRKPALPQQQAAQPPPARQQQPPQQQVPPRPAQDSNHNRSRTAWQQSRSLAKERLPYAPATASAAAAGAQASSKQDSRGEGTQRAGAGLNTASPQQQQPATAQPAEGVHLLPRMADKFVDTMVAQSLDLPPSAARWRQHQRKHSQKQAARRASGVFSVAAIPWATPGKVAGQEGDGDAGVDDIVGGGQDVWMEDEEVVPAPRDVKSRVAGMLHKERLGAGHSWEEEGQE